ncbi:NAD(P)H-binding protein [Sphingomonas sp. NBWT7]|uniref:NAD(P)H-binding protein n=1 Tax=Sphingomonas sp. NBWT7 TaxID=2596913 RepID=UPI00162AF1B3|nr:NAD(P)H-binding protein [Sphingomonas sp. NBWT7]QNE32942.1 NAD(P)H-binding protein [Sphingomonas sp. NBWT7]
MTNILMVGGTGLVGGLVTTRLLRHDDVRLDSLVRSATRVCERPIAFERLVDDPATIPVAVADVGISCLGTTLRAAGSPARFRRVDHDFVVAFARLARRAGARHFILVSSVGAGGRGLYLSVKGEAEAAIRAIGYDRVDILRPSLLLGPRADRRPAEAIAQRVATLIDPLLIGPLRRYAPLRAPLVAAAIETLVSHTAPGVFVHDVPAIRTLAGA